MKLQPRLRRRDHGRSLLAGTKAALVGQPNRSTRLTRLHDRAAAWTRQAVALIALSIAAPFAAVTGIASTAYAGTVALLALALAMIESAVGLVTMQVLHREADERILSGDHLGPADDDEASILLGRARQITTRRYRRALARSLRADLHQDERWCLRTSRPARDVRRLRQHADQVEGIARALEQAGPVDARAVVMVERLLTDPTSPLMIVGAGRVPDVLADIERRLHSSPPLATVAADRRHSAEHRLARAYRFHLAHQDVTSVIPCFCGCDRSLGHRNLRDCYLGTGADGHVEIRPGAGRCPVCRGITDAVIAMYEAGLTAQDIRSAVEGRNAGHRSPTSLPPTPPLAPAC